MYVHKGVCVAEHPLHMYGTVEPLYRGHHWAQLAVLYTVEPLYRGHHWDLAGCPVYSGTSL